MNVNETTLVANVYNLDTAGFEYLWDFGSFVLYGNEESPVRQPTITDLFGSAVSGFDSSYVEDCSPVKTAEVTFYEGDYVVYIDSSPESATHALDPTGELYEVLEQGVESTDGSTNYVVEEADRYSKEQRIVEEAEFEEYWTPIARVDN